MIFGSGVQHLRVKYVEEIPVPIPPLEEQRRIVEIIEQKLSVIDQVSGSVNQLLTKAKHLKQSILQKAFSGKLVEQLPEDGDVEELLKEIKKAKEEYETAIKLKKKKK